MARGLSRAVLPVTESPLVAVDLVAGGGAGELHGAALADVGGGEISGRQSVHDHCLCDLVSTSAFGLHGEGRLVGAGVGIGVVGALSRASLAVAEVPLEAVATGGGAGELGGFAFTYRRGVEAGGRLGIHSDGLRDLVGAAARGLHGEGHLMRARLGEGMRRVLSRASASVTKVPLVVADALTRRSAGELRGLALAYSGGVERCGGQGIDGDCLGDLVGAMSVTRAYRQRDLVGAGVGVGMGWICSRARAFVTEVPLVAANALPRGVGGGGAGELRGVAHTHGGVGKVGCRLWVNDDLGRSRRGLSAYMGHAGVGAGHV